MTETPIDPAAAPITSDVQEGIVALPTVHPTRDVVAQAARLAAAFRAHHSVAMNFRRTRSRAARAACGAFALVTRPGQAGGGHEAGNLPASARHAGPRRRWAWTRGAP